MRYSERMGDEMKIKFIIKRNEMECESNEIEWNMKWHEVNETEWDEMKWNKMKWIEIKWCELIKNGMKETFIFDWQAYFYGPIFNHDSAIIVHFYFYTGKQ